MADKPQSFQNHTRLDPLFHQFLGPLSFILLIAAVTSFVRNVGWTSAFQVLAAIWAVVATFKIRLYALKVQDRVIRLEERLRMHELFSEPLKSRIGEFTESQLIALRFASDTELPALAGKVSRGLTKSRSKLRSKPGVPTTSGSSRIFPELISTQIRARSVWGVMGRSTEVSFCALRKQQDFEETTLWAKTITAVKRRYRTELVIDPARRGCGR